MSFIFSALAFTNKELLDHGQWDRWGCWKDHSEWCREEEGFFSSSACVSTVHTLLRITLKVAVTGSVQLADLRIKHH